MNSTPCPCCRHSSFELLIDWGNLPKTGVFLESPEQPYPKLPLSFEFCSRCALIRRQLNSDSSPDYTQVNRSTDRQLPDYIPQILASFLETNIDPTALIMEIGANEGTFLDKMAEIGFTHRLAVEPSLALAQRCQEKGHLAWNRHLDLTEAAIIREKWGLAELIICRHTLEHIPEPLQFLLAVRSLLTPEGLFFLEVPDTAMILHHLQGQELWDEHLFYFSEDNLTELLKQTGFKLEKILSLPHRTSRNLLCWCRVSAAATLGESFEPISANVAACYRFAETWTAFRQNFLADSQHWKKPIIALGASHLQSNFLNFTGLGDTIDFLIDDDSNKIDHYVPLNQAIPVISTEQLLQEILTGTILRTAFGYDSWMDKICQAFVNKDITIVDPYYQD